MVEDLLHGFAARDWSGALDFASLRSAAGQLCQPRPAAAPRRPGVARALPRRAVAFTYWIVLSVFGALGSVGVLMPATAAWAPNLIFGAAAGCFLFPVRN